MPREKCVGAEERSIQGARRARYVEVKGSDGGEGISTR